jgi:hypothetical protein
VKLKHGALEHGPSGEQIAQPKHLQNFVGAGAAGGRDPEVNRQGVGLEAKAAQVRPDIDPAVLRPDTLDPALRRFQEILDS